MTTRNDVVVDWNDSPRVAEVAAPSDEFIMQDVVDTLRKQEDTFRGMAEDKLLNASGKEALGGGVFVGLTVALQDALIAFQGRTTPAQTGTATSNSGPAITNPPQYSLIDTAATFQTSNVVRGSLVINFTDQSVGEVYRVVSETEIKVKELENGTDNDFDIGDFYHVYNITQVRATGGNLVAVDGNGDPLGSGVLPTWGTQVLITSSSSATLQELADIQYASFNGGISYDEDGPYSGTYFPTGTPRRPVNNPYDAFTIAMERGFNTGFILSDFNAPTDLPLDGFNFIGSGKDRTVISLPDAATVLNCTFIDAEVTGYLDGANTIRDCRITNLSYVKGFIEQCVLESGTIVLAGSDEAHFLDCWSGVPGVSTPTIDCGGSGQALALRNYNGGIKLINKTGPESISIDLASGQVRIDLTTVTNGTLVVRGVGKCVNDATDAVLHTGTFGGLEIINEAINLPEISHEVWGADISKGWYTEPGTMGEFMYKKLLTVKKFIGLK